MTGGKIRPTVEALASTAPANSGFNPIFFIMGIVKLPVVTTFAVLLPEIDPTKALAITAILAGPPRAFFMIAAENS